jgi:PAS domain S-box-containing protein
MISTTPNLATYAAYMRQHALRELAEENVRRLVALEAPLLKAFAHLTPEAFLELVASGLETFLSALEEGRAVEAAAENLRLWEADRLPGVSRDSMAPSDMVLVGAAQKQALLRFIDRVAPDATGAIALALALEAFYTTTQVAAFEAFTRLREAEARRLVARQAEREALLANAQALGNFGSWEWDIETDTVSWSDQLHRIYGLVPGECVLNFETFLQRLHPDDRAQTQAALRQALETASPFAFAERIIRPDGAMRILESTGEVLADAAGKPYLVRGVCQDVTERRQLDERLHTAQEALQAQAGALGQQRSFLAGIFENMPGGIAILDRQLVFQSVNAAYAQLVGRPPEAFLDRYVYDVFPGGESQVGPVFDRVLQTGEAFTAYSFPFTINEAAGPRETFWDFTYAPIRDGAGAVSGILAFCFEVTPRVKLEQEMAEHQALSERMIQNAPGGIAFLDSELVFRRLNHAYAHLLGMTVDQVLDRSLFDVFPGSTDAVEALMREVMATGVPYQSSNYLFTYFLDGEEKRTYWDFTYQPVRDQAGKTGILIMNTEVSHRQERERLQAEQIDQLRALDRYKDEFLSVISHELRTPLNFITGFASTLEDEVQGPLNEAQRVAVGKILSGSDRMLMLVDDLLDFAKLQSGRFEIAPEPTPYAGLVEEVLGLLGPLADQKGLTLGVASLPDCAPVVDPSRIAQVLTNLVGNAIKFTDAGGDIRVQAFVRDGRLVTEVTDTGWGIAPEDVPKLFQRFQQLDMSHTRKAGGTGLGLAIAKALVESHGGSIGVESAPGRGSTFWFSLPLR